MRGKGVGLRVKKIIRKAGLFCGAMLLTLLLAGCADTSVENLMALPQLPPQYTELSKQVDELLKNGYEYASPLTGHNIQSVQMVDLDGDGDDEALAFFRVPSDEKQLKIVVFERDNESYTQLCIIESAGTAIDSVDYQDMTGDGKMELVVGWKISTDVQAVAVYLLDEKPIMLMRSGYAKFSIEELDGDGIPSLLLLRTDKEGNSIAEFYSWRDESLSVSYHCTLSSDMAELSRGSMVSGQLDSNGCAAVFVTGVNTEGMAVTDILTYQKELGLVNVALDAATGRSKAVYEFCQLQPQDIDGDGLIELPYAAADGGGENTAQGVISWWNYDIKGNSYWATDTYHSPNGNWYLDLPHDWHERMTVSAIDSAGNENCVALYVDGDKVAAIYIFSSESADARISQANYQILAQQPTVLYAGEIFRPTAGIYGMDQELLQSSFHLVANFWNS